MKNLLFTALSLAVFFASCSSDTEIGDLSPQTISFDRTEIDQLINQTVSKGQIFDWQSASADMIHSAALLSDSIISIGYTIDTQLDAASFIGTQDGLDNQWLSKRDEIINEILQREQTARSNDQLTVEGLLPFGLDDDIPTISIQITDADMIEELKSRDDIRYIEPMGYELQEKEHLKSSFGCDGSPDNINSADYTQTSTFNAKIPWNFSNHNITSAWSRSSGDNIGVLIVDTGASDNQDNLGSQFASGNSPSRSITRLSTHYSGIWWWRTKDSPHDQCGHGTSMAGYAGAPWSTDGNSVGVAYRSNIVSVRAVNDVIISSSNEKNGVKDALIIAGNRSDVQIASMSIGNIISSGTVRDGVNYAYNRGKLIFAAAGTSTSFTNFVGVIFPANLSNTVAVTGVRDQSTYSRCNNCHSGSAVDFTIQMQRSNDSDRNSISLATSTNTPKYVGGSSAATATTAGIAALVWATNRNMSRNQVLDRMKRASDFYPSRSSSFGYGNINADAAVRGLSF